MIEAPTSATSLLRLTPSTKSQIASFVKQVTESVDNNEVNALDVLIQCRAINKSTDEILEKIAAKILKEADLYPERSFDYLGNALEKSEAGTKYNYAATGDPVWEQLDADANRAIERRKEREAFLRTIKDADVTKAVNPETGEEVTLRPAPKTSTSIVKVTLK